MAGRMSKVQRTVGVYEQPAARRGRLPRPALYGAALVLAAAAIAGLVAYFS
jgi:hypothetical protein